MIIIKKQKIKWPIFFKVSLIAFFVSILSQLYFSNSLAIKTSDLSNLHDIKVELQKEVARLEFEDSVLSSIVSVEKRAKDLGFSDNLDSVYSLDIKIPVSLASANQF